MAWPSVRLWRQAMACMYGRCRRVCGVVVVCAGVVYRRWCTVLWRCVGTVYGVQALGVRVWCALCVYVVYIVL